MHSSGETGSTGAGGSGEMNFMISPSRSTNAAVVAVGENAHARAVVHAALAAVHASLGAALRLRLVLRTSTITLLPAGCSYSCVKGMQKSKSTGAPPAAASGMTTLPLKTSVGDAEKFAAK